MKSRRKLPQSSLVGRRGEPFDGVALEVWGPRKAFLEVMEADWPGHRFPGDEHLGWCWKRLGARSRDVMILVDAERNPVAAFCSSVGTVTLDGSVFYRLDYFEVRGDLRGSGLGVVLAAAACARATELGAESVLLASLPQAADFWRRLGTQGAPKGWSHPAELLAFTLSPEVTTHLARLFHDSFDAP